MKKTLIVLSILISILCLNKKEYTKIPQEAIRFRIIASSNEIEDQNLKKEIAQNIFPQLTPIKNFENIQETREYIKKELPHLEEIVDKTLKESNSKEVFHINYGKNYFPQKKYQNKTYPEGKYESLVITLGEGLGENFWCVLFPPICFLEEDENIEYKSFLKEIIDKYF